MAIAIEILATRDTGVGLKIWRVRPIRRPVDVIAIGGRARQRVTLRELSPRIRVCPR